MQEAGPGRGRGRGISYEQFLEQLCAGVRDQAAQRPSSEVAAMAPLLASDVGGGITGALINVDGGTAQW